MLDALVQPFIVLVAVTVEVVVTLIGLIVAPLLQFNSLAAITFPLPSFAVIVVVPLQLSVFDNIGAAGVGLTVKVTAM